MKYRLHAVAFAAAALSLGHAAWVNLGFVGLSEKSMAWFNLEQEPSVWISLVVSMLLLALILRKG